MLDSRRLPQIDICRYREIFDFPVLGYYQKLGFDFEAEPFETLAHLFCDTYDRRVAECKLQDGVRTALGHFSEQGGMQSILSSSEQSALDNAILEFGLDGEFSKVVGRSDRYAAGKYEAGSVLMAASGIPANRTVLIGDTLHDHEVAQALGVDTILVTVGHHSSDKLKTAGSRVVDSLEEAVAYAS